jgi:hypothetical protein
LIFDWAKKHFFSGLDLDAFLLDWFTSIIYGFHKQLSYRSTIYFSFLVYNIIKYIEWLKCSKMVEKRTNIDQFEPIITIMFFMIYC